MRFEIFYKSQSEAVKLISLLSLSGFKKFNFPNKLKTDDLISVASSVKSHFPDSDICLHYATRYHNRRHMQDTFEDFESFLSAARVLGISKVLLVSGGGEKKSVNSLSCLEYLQSKQYILSGIEIGVAFNPFFSNEADICQEKLRLNAKLNTGLVSHVWLQFGTDTNLLNESLKYLNKLDLKGKNIKIIGSIFLPSKILLARMKFRPWNGVFLSDVYLNNLDIAISITKELISIYQSYKIEILIETSVGQKELLQLNDLFGERIPQTEPLEQAVAISPTVEQTHHGITLIDLEEISNSRKRSSSTLPIESSNSYSNKRQRGKKK